MGSALHKLSLRLATAFDAARLARLARTTFVDTFGAANTDYDMEIYTSKAFGEQVQLKELTDPHNVIFVAEQASELVGYVMLRESDTPSCVSASSAVEISRLYVSQAVKGQGVGAALMRRALDEASDRGHDAIWLGVWERNVHAISFYLRFGFQQMGTQTFVLGTDRQTDYIMMRPIKVIH
jgi:ribosomal protein S18 acetylase RimI-like enzyme